MKDSKLKETYNKIARDWGIDHSKDTWWIKYTDELARLLPKGATVLDIGCAQGFKASYLASKGLQVTGIDFSEEMIALAKEQYPAIKFQVFDMYDLDNFPGQFDCVFALAVLLHVPHKEIFNVMSKMASKVKSGGLFFICVKAPKSEKKEEIIKKTEYGYEYERFFSYHTKEEMEDFFKKLNFKILLSDSSLAGGTIWVQIIGQLVF